jgi:hypothetical protein
LQRGGARFRAAPNSPERSAAVLNANVYTAPDAIRGFDANCTIGADAAAAYLLQGYRFVVRYVRRLVEHEFDLTATEAAGILEAGLGLMVVQHVESESSWVPAPETGAANGLLAAQEAAQIGIPPGVTVWCDLEGVAEGTPPAHVAMYCNNWHAAVAGAGYVPGLYVGWHSGLSPQQLYQALRFTHYWGAYNLNSDEAPAVRGLQMQQSARTPSDAVPGCQFGFQVDTIRTDALGGRPILAAPAGWRV